MQSCVHSFFFCPTDRPTFTRGRAMVNETFYGDGLISPERRLPELSLQVILLGKIQLKRTQATADFEFETKA